MLRRNEKPEKGIFVSFFYYCFPGHTFRRFHEVGLKKATMEENDPGEEREGDDGTFSTFSFSQISLNFLSCFLVFPVKMDQICYQV